ncbi:hypothetical protein F2P81_012851 [Scophthalmus maximus]|uniref:Uncharacterized protein n=1 Tax=Scophthalmus maximus TaxID=52904 RepID=A0A6A4SLX2_SCOMX|nr:hypothetical protein F2P81_012851 [Scophthalmus maximus]
MLWGEMMTVLHRANHFTKPEERVAAGAIDGSTIRILPPKERQKRSYIGRKLFPSVLLHGFCDAHFLLFDLGIQVLDPQIPHVLTGAVSTSCEMEDIHVHR